MGLPKTWPSILGDGSPSSAKIVSEVPSEMLPGGGGHVVHVR